MHIVVWFREFEYLSEMLGWSDEQRVDGLVRLLGPALNRLVCEKQPKYELIKNDTIDLVNRLLSQECFTRNWDYIATVVIPIFDQNRFTNSEKRHWLACMASPEHLLIFAGLCNNEGDNFKMKRFLQRAFE